MDSVGSLVKRSLFGRPLRSDRLGDTLLPKSIALPVFCSDPLSSVAYATEAILAILALGGIAYYTSAPWLALGVVVLLVTVTLSYRQTIAAYPNGGGAYIVSAENLGRSAALTAASALMVDYVLTVAVSVSAGVTAITSASPGLLNHKVSIAVGFVVLLTVVNLRGIKESGKLFAIPTYGFVFFVYLMFAFAAVKLGTGSSFRAVSADYQAVDPEQTGGLLTVFLLLRAFANGCTALTGVEAISNGVPAFRKPKAKNAANTLTVMAALAITMFIGITLLAIEAKVHVAESPGDLGLTETPPSALAQLGTAAFGGGPLFYLLQAFTAGILVLAANTAYNGFPVLASILAQDRYLPRQLHTRGDRLVFSNGVLLLAGFAILLIVGFQADVNRLIQLYILGVFISFTLSQTGMVRHWNKELATGPPPARRRAIRRSQLINTLGASCTGLVLVIVLATKFVHGAWIVVIAIPLLFLVMRSIRGHYDSVSAELVLTVPQPGAPAGGLAAPTRVLAVVLVSRLHAPTLQALSYARSTRPYSLVALTVAVDDAEARELRDEWDERGMPVDLVVLASPYREVTRPVLDYVARLKKESPRDVVSVYVPEYVVGHWWEQLLHNQSALRIKARLLFVPGVMVTSVPYQLQSSRRAGPSGRVAGAGPGNSRQGRPDRPPGPSQPPAAGPMAPSPVPAGSPAADTQP